MPDSRSEPRRFKRKTLWMSGMPTQSSDRNWRHEGGSYYVDVTEDYVPKAEVEQLRADFAKLGAAFATIWSQALNGVVCEPGQAEIGRHNCRACRDAWKTGTDVLAAYDPKYANIIRSGPMFQPSVSVVAPDA